MTSKSIPIQHQLHRYLRCHQVRVEWQYLDDREEGRTPTWMTVCKNEGIGRCQAE
jgi:hypothetical protein